MLSQEQLLVKAAIRAHLLTDYSTAYCRTIMEHEAPKFCRLDAAMAFSDDEFIKAFGEWKNGKKRAGK